MELQYTPCARCLKLYLNDLKRMQNGGPFKVQPCVRIEILGLPLHRKGPTKYSELDTWLPQKQAQLEWHTFGNTTRVFKLTQGFGEGMDNALRLQVSRFKPGPGDRTAYFWTDEKTGLLRSMEMPPYFISDMDAAKASVVEFLRNARSVYIDTLLGDASPITRKTFESALRFSAFGQVSLIVTAGGGLTNQRYRANWYLLPSTPGLPHGSLKVTGVSSRVVRKSGLTPPPRPAILTMASSQ